jgi:hypothetical protein
MQANYLHEGTLFTECATSLLLGQWMIERRTMARTQIKKSVRYDKKQSGRGETWSIRGSDGRSKTVKTSKASAAAIDKAAARFAGALKRLAKR